MRAVLYCRVSSHHQVQSLSLDTQQDACQAYAQRHGYTVDRVFIDAGESAKTTERPDFLKLLTYCRERKGKLHAVIVYSLTRFSRNSADHHAIVTLLRGLGITLRSVTEPIDESPSGRLMEGILAAMAQFDNDVRSERVVAGMKASIARGRWVWRAPIGYQNADARIGPSLVPDPARAPAVRKAFEWCAAGILGRELHRKVTALGLVTTQGCTLSLNRLYEVLRHPAYVGVIRSDAWQAEVRGDFDPLVSDDLFARVQLQLSRTASNGARKIVQRKNHPQFPLRRFVRCAACRKPLTGSLSRSRNGRQYPFYHCQAGCTNVAKAQLETAFLALLDTLTPQPEYWRLFTTVVSRVWQAEEQREQEAATIARRRVTDLQGQLTRLERAFIFEERIDKQSYVTQRDQLREQLALARIAVTEADTKALDVEGLLAFAEHTLQHGSALWTAATSVEERMRLQTVLFPSGLTWDMEHFSTPVSCLAFFELPALDERLTGMVDHMQPKWNRVKDWLVHLQQHLGRAA